MKKLSGILATCAILFSSLGHAVDKEMTFRFVSFGSHQYEISSTWDPNAQEIMIRMGLVPIFIDSSLAEKTFSFSNAQRVGFYLLDAPELSLSCQDVVGWNFEYTPDLPSLVMYLTLRGPGCKKIGEHLEIYRTRVRFESLALQPGENIDLSVEISR